jgi:hypothetical protein
MEIKVKIMDISYIEYCLLITLESKYQDPSENYGIMLDGEEKVIDLFKEIGNEKSDILLSELERKKVIKIIKPPFGFDLSLSLLGIKPISYYFIKAENFYLYLKKLEEKFKDIVSKSVDDYIEFEIFYDDFSRRIIIKDITKNINYLLKTPNYDSINNIVFKYLYDHPDIEIKKTVLDSIVLQSVDKTNYKTLRKIVSDLGFTGNLHKAFIIVTKNTIKVRKKVTKKNLQELNIDLSDDLEKLITYNI